MRISSDNYIFPIVNRFLWAFARLFSPFKPPKTAPSRHTSNCLNRSSSIVFAANGPAPKFQAIGSTRT